MPELRKDPVVGRWVIIAKERARRPGNFVDPVDDDLEDDPKDCLFCQSKQKPVFKKGDAKVVPYHKSFLHPDSSFNREKQGVYDVVDGFGTHEIVIESSEHVANIADLTPEQIQDVLQCYAERMTELGKNKDYKYLLAYKNYGTTAGSRGIGHTRSHIIATPVIPLRVKEKLVGAIEYVQEHDRCIFCDLIKQEQEEEKRIIAENDNFIAITPFAARFLFEIWILPKDHACDFPKGVKGKEDSLAQMLKDLLKKMQVGLEDAAYNYVIQTAPLRHGRNKEEVNVVEEGFHWHIEIMPRMSRVAGFEKGTGFYICPIPPEDGVEYLRSVNNG